MPPATPAPTVSTRPCPSTWAGRPRRSALSRAARRRRRTPSRSPAPTGSRRARGCWSRPRSSKWSRSARAAARSHLSTGWGGSRSARARRARSRGRPEPTVTDANLVLGRIDAESFAGGTIPLDETRAGAALDEGLARAGLSTIEAAYGVTEMDDENMANAARVHAVEHGRDIEQFTMIAFGGGAPLHAARLC